MIPTLAAHGPRNALGVASFAALVLAAGCQVLAGIEDRQDAEPGTGGTSASSAASSGGAGGAASSGGAGGAASSGGAGGAGGAACRLATCGGACVDLSTDAQHCGKCGRACDECAAGRCVRRLELSPTDPPPDHPHLVEVTPGGDIVWTTHDPDAGTDSALFLKPHDHPDPIFLVVGDYVGDLVFQPADGSHGARVVYPRVGASEGDGRLEAVDLTKRTIVPELVTGLYVPTSVRAVGETLYFNDLGEGTVNRKGELDAAPVPLASGQIYPDRVRVSGGDVFWMDGEGFGAISRLPGGAPGATPITWQGPDEVMTLDVEGDLVCYSNLYVAGLACGSTSLEAFSPVPGVVGYTRSVVFHEDHLYWTTWSTTSVSASTKGGVFRISTARLADGTVTAADIETLVDGVTAPFDLAFDAENVYFTAWAASASGGGIYAVSKDPF